MENYISVSEKLNIKWFLLTEFLDTFVLKATINWSSFLVISLQEYCTFSKDYTIDFTE